MDNTPRAACGVTPLKGGGACGPAKPVPRHRWMGVASLVAALLFGTALPVNARQVALSGVAGGKALVHIDGDSPRFMAPGQTHQGVKLLSLQGDAAVFDINGQRQTLHVGDAPVSVGKGSANADTPGARRIVLTADARGHFLPAGQINGRPVQFLVDTGASTVALSESDAKRIHLDYTKGRRVGVNTANGATVGYQVKLDSVRVGDVLVYAVDAIVLPQPMSYVLLGNSFLTRFQMQRNNDQLTLEKRF